MADVGNRNAAKNIKKDSSIKFRIEDDIKEKLRLLAKKEGCSVTKIITDLISDELSKHSFAEQPRLVCWYSHGAASLIAAKLAIENQPTIYPNHKIVVACIHIKNELHEPERIKKVEAFLGHKITFLQDKKYSNSVDVVIQKTRYMSGIYGARCTKELKKQVRLDWQRFSDTHVFGMDSTEEDRIDNLLATEPELDIYAPLIDAGLTKKDCFKMMLDAGLELPKMYKLGYHNNNCVGCLKAGGAGYWNKIRKDFPDVFERRSHQEKMLNVCLVKISANVIRRDFPEVFDQMKSDGYTPKIDSKNSMRIPLRYLPATAGNHKDLDIGDCSIICELKN